MWRVVEGGGWEGGGDCSMWSGYRQSIPWCGPPPLPPPELSEQLPLHSVSLDARVVGVLDGRRPTAAFDPPCTGLGG